MSTRPRVFLDIESRVSSGRVFIELYNDLAPKASENFRCLCVGDQISLKAPPTNVNTNSGAASESKKSKKQKQKKFSLKNVRFHRVVAPEFIVQAGEDLDGESIYYNAETKSYYFAGENNSTPVNERGLLCMANENGDPDKNTSQFFITLQNGLGIEGCTVFGRIVRGMEVLEGLEDVVVDDEDRPAQGDEVFIRRSGELELKNKSRSVEKANATNETATNENNNADTGEKPLEQNLANENAVENELNKNVTVEKLSKDETLGEQKSKDSTDKKDSEQSEPTSNEQKSKSSENFRPSLDDKETSRRNRDDYDQDRSSRRGRDERHRYDRDDRSRYNKEEKSQYERDNRRYERNDRGRYDRYDRDHYSRDDREDRRRHWDDRRLQAPRRDEDRPNDKNQPKVIFKGRGSMKYKDREFGRL